MKGDNSHAIWEKLYEAKAPELVLYGRALGLSHGEAEDVLQETFISLLELSPAPNEAQRYCLRAYRNMALNYKRGLWRRLKRELESHRWFEPNDPESPAERRAMRFLEDLPREQREAVVLKVWHGYTFEQIAELTSVSPNTVSGRYRYALQKLRDALKGHEDEERLGDAITFMGAAPPIAEA